MAAHPKDDYAEIVELVRGFARRELALVVDELDEKEEPLPGHLGQAGGAGPARHHRSRRRTVGRASARWPRRL